MPQKKKSSKPSKRKITHAGTKHIQYFYGIVAILGLVSFSAGMYHASTKQDVLGAEHRNEDAPRLPREDRQHSESEEAERMRRGPKLDNMDGDLTSDNRQDRKHEGSESGKNRERMPRDPRVIVLPEQAVKTLLEKGKITAVSSPSAIATDSAVYTFVKGKPVYIIQGTDDKKFLGVLPVKVKKNIVISAENGEVQETKMSPLDVVLNFFSFK